MMKKGHYRVIGMSCTACAAAIDRVLKKTTGIGGYGFGPDY